LSSVVEFSRELETAETEAPMLNLKKMLSQQLTVVELKKVVNHLVLLLRFNSQQRHVLL
jgi:hypothetical protein